MFKQIAITYFFSSNTAANTSLTPYRREIHYNQARGVAAGIKENSCHDGNRMWNGFLFTATNNFTEYKVLNLIHRQVNEKFVCTPGHEVANATVDDDGALTNIAVIPEFRGNKIGSELIRFINKSCGGQFNIFGGREHNSRYRLSEEGAALAQYCVKNGIIGADQFIRDEVPPSPESSLGF